MKHRYWVVMDKRTKTLVEEAIDEQIERWEDDGDECFVDSINALARVAFYQAGEVDDGF